MFITMHCGGMPFNGDTIKKASLGGSESAAYYVAKELTKRGHRVTLFTNEQQDGDFDGVKYNWAGEISKEFPMGERFQFFVNNTPQDLAIIQRLPFAFRQRIPSKLNFWWMHDLALGRFAPEVNAQLWNVDRTMVVSDWHKAQVQKTYGLKDPEIFVTRNGVDGAVYGDASSMMLDVPEDCIKLVYTSRPERGLEHLVRPGGIMERLQEKAPGKFKLFIAMYANFPEHMREFYSWIGFRCEKLKDCIVPMGCLDKAKLASLQLACDAWVYPTEFDEVSCITAMEAVSAGLNIFTSDNAAIGETITTAGLGNFNATLIPLKDGKADEDAFVEKLLAYTPVKLGRNPDAYPWAVAAAAIEREAEACFAEARSNVGACAKELMRNGDIYALQEYLKLNGTPDTIAATVAQEMNNCYAFAFDNNFAAHYKAYYQYEKDRGVNYGPETLEGTPRYMGVRSMLAEAKLQDGAYVLDYGCAHGHYTINLAKCFPNLTFIGMDIEASNIAKAKEWAKEDGVENVRFFQGTVPDLEQLTYRYSAIIAAEVLEHLEDVPGTIDALGSRLTDDGRMIITTPIGPWEYEGAKQHHPWRAHLHHLERQDLKDIAGMHPNFKLVVAPGGKNRFQEILGSYITCFGKPAQPSGKVDYTRKFSQLVPRQTLSACMIVKDGETTLLKTLQSIEDAVDEIIIGLDSSTTDNTMAVIQRFRDLRGWMWPIVKVIDIEPALKTGFDAARNATIETASGQWILWVDADEVMDGAHEIAKYLRQSHYDGFAVSQHHISMVPIGVMRTDKPTRLFRNGRGVKFYGRVHEHPEKVMNEGVGHVVHLPDVQLTHVGYSSEDVRKKRFMRNIGLMARDRLDYPMRLIGRFLWVRDLAMMCRMEGERNGGVTTPEMVARAEEGIALFEELITDSDIRQLLDGVEFYSMLCSIKGGGISFEAALGALPAPGMTGDALKVHGHFSSVSQARRFLMKMYDERTKGYEDKYF